MKQADQCFVDLDDALIETPEEQPCFPNQKEIVSQLISYLEDYQTEVRMQNFCKKNVKHFCVDTPCFDASSLAQWATTHGPSVFTFCVFSPIIRYISLAYYY